MARLQEFLSPSGPAGGACLQMISAARADWTSVSARAGRAARRRISPIN